MCGTQRPERRSGSIKMSKSKLTRHAQQPNSTNSPTEATPLRLTAALNSAKAKLPLTLQTQEAVIKSSSLRKVKMLMRQSRGRLSGSILLFKHRLV